MILVDTSVWIDFLRHGDSELQNILESAQVLTHPFVIGELALGNLQSRDNFLQSLNKLPVAKVARDSEVMHFIDEHALYGIGIGYIDAHLLAAVRLTPGSELWTRDRRLLAAAVRFNIASTHQ